MKNKFSQDATEKLHRLHRLLIYRGKKENDCLSVHKLKTLIFMLYKCVTKEHFFEILLLKKCLDSYIKDIAQL